MRDLSKKALSLVLALTTVVSMGQGAVSVTFADDTPTTDEGVVVETEGTQASEAAVDELLDSSTVSVTFTDDGAYVDNASADQITTDNADEASAEVVDAPTEEPAVNTEETVVPEVVEEPVVVEEPEPAKGAFGINMVNEGGKVVIIAESGTYTLEVVNGKATVKDQWNNYLAILDEQIYGFDYMLTELVGKVLDIQVFANEGYNVAEYRIYIDGGGEYTVPVANMTYTRQYETITEQGKVLAVSFVKLPEEIKEEEVKEESLSLMSTATVDVEEVNSEEVSEDKSLEESVEETVNGETEENAEEAEDIVDSEDNDEAVVDGDEATKEEADEITDETTDEVVDETTDEVVDEVVDEATEEADSKDEVAEEVNEETTEEKAIEEEIIDESKEETADEIEDAESEEEEQVVIEKEVLVEVPVDAGRFEGMDKDAIIAYISSLSDEEKAELKETLTEDEAAYIYRQFGITKDMDEESKKNELGIIAVIFREGDKYAVEGYDYTALSGIDFSKGRLIVFTSNPDIFVEDETVVSSYNGMYILQFTNYETTMRAYAYYSGIADSVIVDTDSLEISDTDKTEEANEDEEIPEGATVVEVEVIDENSITPEDGAKDEILEVIEQENSSNEPVQDIAEENILTEGNTPLDALETSAGYGYDIALIDTGATGANASVSVIGDDVTDGNGHGTDMLGYIRQMNPNASVLSIKAFDTSGRADVSSIYAAFEYAINSGVKIINLSASGYYTENNSLIIDIINRAINSGIIVVGAAGNYSADAGYFIPGCVDGAYIIGAYNKGTLESTDEGISYTVTKDLAGGSNFGNNVDYYVVARSSSQASALFAGYVSKEGLNNFEEYFESEIELDPEVAGLPIHTPVDGFTIAGGGSSGGGSWSGSTGGWSWIAWHYVYYDDEYHDQGDHGYGESVSSYLGTADMFISMFTSIIGLPYSGHERDPFGVSGATTGREHLAYYMKVACENALSRTGGPNPKARVIGVALVVGGLDTWWDISKYGSDVNGTFQQLFGYTDSNFDDIGSPANSANTSAPYYHPWTAIAPTVDKWGHATGANGTDTWNQYVYNTGYTDAAGTSGTVYVQAVSNYEPMVTSASIHVSKTTQETNPVLVVKKELSSGTADWGENYQFQVTYTDASGVAHTNEALTLSAGGSKSYTCLPGSYWKVVETTPNSTGHYELASGSATREGTFGSKPNTAFSYRLVYIDVDGTTKTETFTLSNGQSKDFNNVKPNSQYTITETIPSGWECTNSWATNGSWTGNANGAGQVSNCNYTNLYRNTDHTEVFYNKLRVGNLVFGKSASDRTGSLRVNKVLLDGPASDRTKDFPMTLTLNSGASSNYSYTRYNANNVRIGEGSVKGDGSQYFYLKPSEYVIIRGLPAGATYTVTEPAMKSTAGDEMFTVYTTPHESTARNERRYVTGTIPTAKNRDSFTYTVSNLDRTVNYYVYSSYASAMAAGNDYIRSGSVANNGSISIKNGEYVLLWQVLVGQNVSVKETVPTPNDGTWYATNPTNATITKGVVAGSTTFMGTQYNEFQPEEHNVTIYNHHDIIPVKVYKQSTNNDCTDQLTGSKSGFNALPNGYSQNFQDAEFRIVTKDVNNGSTVTDVRKNPTYIAGEKRALISENHFIGESITVTETIAPKGYALPNPVTQTKEVRRNEALNVFTFSDLPLFDPFQLRITKVDEFGNIVKSDRLNQAKATFKVTYYDSQDKNNLGAEKSHWYIQTDANGSITFPSVTTPITWKGDTSSSVYTNSSGVKQLPIGIYKIEEVESPDGFKEENYVAYFRIWQSSNGVSTTSHEWVQGSGSIKYKEDGSIEYEDKQFYGSIEIKKEDLESTATQADTDFRDIEVTIYNNSGTTIYLKDGTSVANGAAICTLRFGRDGDNDDIVSTKNFYGSDFIPIGKVNTFSYKVKETATNTKYLLNSDWEMMVKMTDPNDKSAQTELPLVPNYNVTNQGLQVVSHGPGENAVNDQVVRGGIKLYKVDEDREDAGEGNTDKATPEGAATLAGAEFTIYNISVDGAVNKDNISSGQKTETGKNAINAIINHESSASAYKMQTIVTNGSGVATTGAYDLPYGTYIAVETKAPTGYNLNKTYYVKFQIREDGVVIDTATSANGSGKKTTASLANNAVSGWFEVGGKETTNDQARGDDPVKRGMITVHKTDRDINKNNIMTNGEDYYVQNGDGDISGIKFAIVLDKTTPSGANQEEVYVPEKDAGGVKYNPGEVVEIITTDEHGIAKTGEKDLPYGYYSVYELEETSQVQVGQVWGGQKEPGDGIYANESHTYLYAKNFTNAMFVNEEGANVETKYTDYKTPGYADVIKVDYNYENKDFGVEPNTPQGDASLSGIKMAIVNRSEHSVWYPANNANSVEYEVGDVVDIIVTDEQGKCQSKFLPFGTYEVIEMRVDNDITPNEPWEDRGTSLYCNNEGYMRDENTNTIEIREHKKTYNSRFVDHVVRGNLTGIKLDNETADGAPTNGLSLKGAEITMVNASKKAVVYVNEDDQEIKDDWRYVKTTGYTDWPTWNDVANASSDCIYTTTLTTDDEGHFSIKNIPYGTYYFVESDPPTGYKFNKKWVAKAVVRQDGTEITYRITDEGAENVSNATGSNRLANDPYRIDFNFLKLNIDGTPIPYVPFLMTRFGVDGEPVEQHVFVTNEEGWYESAAHDKTASNVNSLDEYNVNLQYVKNGTLSDGTAADSDVAVWFGEQGARSNDKGALIYGEYDIRELQTPRTIAQAETLQYTHINIDKVITWYNEYHDALAKDGTVADKNSEDFPQRDIHMVAMVDPEVKLETFLLDSVLGLQMTRLGEDVVVTDTIHYDHLDDRNTYKWIVTVRDTEDDEIIGQTIVENWTPESTTSTAHTTNADQFDVDVHLNTMRYANVGGTMYATTELYMYYTDPQTGEVHEPIVTIHNMGDNRNTDPNEQISIPEVLTVAEDVLSAKPEITASIPGDAVNDPERGYRDHVGVWGTEENIALANSRGVSVTQDGIEDTVVVHNLAGERSQYRLVAEAYNNKTGEMIGTSSLRFATPSQLKVVPSIVRTMPIIPFDSTNFRDLSITVYEYVYFVDEQLDGSFNEILINWHKVEEEFDQSTYYPGITTEALASNNLHGMRAENPFTINDTVTMTNLVPGESYKLTGIVMDKDTGEPLLDDHGNQIKIEDHSFTASDFTHEEVLTFTFDILETAIAKDEVINAVPFVELYHDDYLVADHKDINDASELVIITPPPYKHYKDNTDWTEETVVTTDSIIPYKLSWVQAKAVSGDVEVVDTLSEGLVYVPGTTVFHKTTGVDPFNNNAEVSYINSLTGSTEPSVSADGRTLTWHFTNMPVGTFIKVDYQVQVTSHIIRYPLVNNDYDLYEVTPTAKEDINELENPGNPEKFYDAYTNIPVPVLAETSTVYSTKNIEYSLLWINKFTKNGVVCLKDTLSAGQTYNAGSAQIVMNEGSALVDAPNKDGMYTAPVSISNVEPTVTVNADGTTTLEWQFIVAPHQWGTVNYTTTVNTKAATVKEGFKVNNHYEFKEVPEGTDPSHEPYRDIRVLTNLVPHYVMDKVRVTDAREKVGTSNAYGFYRGDTATYKVTITNDGAVDLYFNVNDFFLDDSLGGSTSGMKPNESFFKSLHITKIVNGKEVEFVDFGADQYSADLADKEISIPVGTTAVVTFDADVNWWTPEYLAPNAADDKANDGDGYFNAANTYTVSTDYSEVGHEWTYHEYTGKNVTLVGGTIVTNSITGKEEVNDETFEGMNHDGVVLVGGSPVISDELIPELRQRADTANTPVQTPDPKYTMEKHRVTDSSLKVHTTSDYGFFRADTVEYEVIVKNTGNMDIDVTVTDAFNTDAANGHGAPNVMFEDLKIKSVEGTEIKRLDDVTTRVHIPMGEQVRVIYTCDVELHAEEYLAPDAKDIEYVEDAVEKLLTDGYLNTAETKDVVAYYITNNGKTVLVHGPDEEEHPSQYAIYHTGTLIIDPETGGYKEASEYIDINAEPHTPYEGLHGNHHFTPDTWIDELKNKEDTANTPVQVPVPDYTLVKERVTDASVKVHTPTDEDGYAPASIFPEGAFGFFRGDTIVYDVTVTNTGDLDLVMNVNDAFNAEIAKYFTGLHIIAIDGEEIERISDTETRVYVPIDGKVTVTYSAKASMIAVESLAKLASDETKDYIEEAEGETLESLLKDPEFDLLGYLNTATSTKVVATYNTPTTDKPVVIHGPNDGDKSNVTEVFEPGTDPIRDEETPTPIKASEPNEEFAENLKDKDDVAHTPIQNPVPNYTMEKVRVTDSTLKINTEEYGFMRGDEVEYRVTIVNTGDLDLEMVVSDAFSDELIDVQGHEMKVSDIFDNLHIDRVVGTELERIDDVTTLIDLPIDGTVEVYYKAIVGDRAPEYLAPEKADIKYIDDVPYLDDGYINTATTTDVIAKWTVNTGEEIRIDKDFNPDPETGKGEFYDELNDKSDDANTPVQVPTPHYVMDKHRVTDARQKINTEEYGFFRQDRVYYEVTVENDGELDLEMVVTDAFNSTPDAFENVASKWFEELKIVSVQGTELERIDDVTTKIELKIGEKAVITYSAKVKLDAPEYLAPTAADVKFDEEGNEVLDDGYINTATVKDVEAKWTTNTGEEKRIDKDSNPDPDGKGEFYDELKEQEDTANTPVQVPKPHYVMDKYRITEAGQKINTEMYGFRRGDAVYYQVTVTNDGELDLDMLVTDEFNKDVAPYFNDLKLMSVSTYSSIERVKVLKDEKSAGGFLYIKEGLLGDDTIESDGEYAYISHAVYSPVGEGNTPFTQVTAGNAVGANIHLNIGETAILVFKAYVGMDAPEYLAPTEYDNKAVLDDGYINVARTTNVEASWETNEGEKVVIDKDTNPGPDGTGEFFNELKDQEDDANTPVQVPVPHYDLTKERVNDATQKKGTEQYGFKRGDTVTYEVTVVNNGEMDLEMNISDEFSSDEVEVNGAKVKPVDYFDNLRIIKVQYKDGSKKLADVSKTEVRVDMPIGSTVVVTYAAVVKLDAPEFLSDHAKDDGMGYLNTAKATKVIGKYITNEDTPIIVDKNDYPELEDQEDDANTPVQIPHPQYEMEKERVSQAPIKEHTTDYGFLRGSKVEYKVTIKNTGDIDLYMNVTDEFDSSIASYFKDLKIKEVKCGTNSKELDRVSSTETRIFVKVDETVEVYYTAIVAESALEKLSKNAKDDGLGYLNIAKTTNVTGEYKTNTGEKITVTPKEFPEELEDKTDTANTPVQVPQPKHPGIPHKTGDENNMAMWLMLAGVALVSAITGFVVYRKKRKGNSN